MEAVEGIRAFWTWWATARHRLLKAIEVDRAFGEDLVEDISTHVSAIGDLDWELGAGTTSRHAFFLSAKGDPAGRLVTELWRSMGPAPDEEWSYFPARQPRRGTTLKFADVVLPADDLRVTFEVELARERVHGSYFHPGFAKLDENGRGVALFLLLDGEFGEDGVERWLGGVDVLDDATDTKPFAEFRAAVDQLTKDATGERFAIFEGETESGEPLFVTVNLALKRIDHLLHTQHVAIDVAILDQNEHGLPTNADAEQLNALEDALAAALGGHAVYFGRETRPGHRTCHWYAPEDSPVKAIVERWSKDHADRKPEVMFAHDPAWEFVKRY
ncbi:MAG: DUF695 domain-containing protein [Myxococcota bacterium]|nr:DUF695 domain-containing protein [Myxococcota bacterium]